jgi:hypothetical protein
MDRPTKSGPSARNHERSALTHIKDLVVPPEGLSEVILGEERVALFLQEPQALHVDQVLKRARPPRAGKHPDEAFRFVRLSLADRILGRFRVEESVLAVEGTGVFHRGGGGDGVAGAFEDPGAEHVQVGEGGGVREGELERREGDRVLAELRVVRSEEEEGPEVRRGRLDCLVCEQGDTRAVQSGSEILSAEMTRK